MPGQPPAYASSPALDPQAERIAVALLERTGRALLTRDADLFLPTFALPLRISTFEDSFDIEDEAHLRRAFHKMCDELAKMGVTTLSRQCIAAVFRGPDTIAHTYLSHILVGQVLLKAPYPCFSVLKRIDGVWKVTSTDYALERGTGQSRALLSGATTQPPGQGLSVEASLFGAGRAT